MTETEIWVEKYRPTKFNDIVLSNINRNLFKNLIEMKYFPNLLFYGPPGTGKTTTIINLINEYQQTYGEINSSTVVHLNASDERGIDTIRNQINLFVKTNNLFVKGIKFVILDEVDYMTKNAQQALKYILQNSSYNVRFCLICNYISKIDDSLKTEFICVRFNQLPLEYMHKFLKNITEKEGFPLEIDTIKFIQEMYGSDIRSMINFIQLNQNLNVCDDDNETPPTVVHKPFQWNNNIITTKVFEELHNYLCDTMNRNDEPPILSYFNKLSIQLNIERKTLLLKYFNWVIRNRKLYITPEFLNKVETVIHDTEDVPFDIIMKYYICS
jgi:DNA polymerase III delta prime subunit